MRRREFIAAIGSTACAWPCVLVAQVPSKHPLIGYLGVASAEASARMIGVLLQGLHELGYQEGRNFDIAYRFADGDDGETSEADRRFASPETDVIFAINATPVKLATTTIPIVSPVLDNPVRLGLVASYARHGR